jgi:hypothetical protein
MKEKQISPSEALKRGVKAMLAEPMPDFKAQKIEVESEKSKLERTVSTMQSCIDELNKKLEAKQ